MLTYYKYLQGVLVGDKGVGKTFSMDVSARLLTGLVETNKFNNLTDTQQLKGFIEQLFFFHWCNSYMIQVLFHPFEFVPA